MVVVVGKRAPRRSGEGGGRKGELRFRSPLLLSG